MTIGDKFGDWTIVGKPETRRGKSVFDFCRCVCGKEKFVKRDSLTHGTSKSCGCTYVRAKHGMYKTKAYLAWQQAKKRCRNPLDKNYPSYGGRGIKFHDGWDKFEEFFLHMGPAAPGLSLGRIDNNGHYEPGNCRWENWTTQARNKRNTVYLTIDGETKPMADWADSSGVMRGTVKQRLRMGWSHKEAVYGKAKS